MTRSRQIGAVVVAVAVVAAMLFAVDRAFHDEMFPVVVGTGAPAFHAATLDKVPRTKSLDDYRGQVVLLNVWATWCLPCRVEMPSIEKLHQAYAAKGLKVVAVSIDDPGTEQQVRDFVKTFGLTFEILYDPKNVISKDYQIGGYPETFVLGRDGIIRKKVMEATDWNSPENRALIERLLAEKAD